MTRTRRGCTRTSRARLGRPSRGNLRTSTPSGAFTTSPHSLAHTFCNRYFLFSFPSFSSRLPPPSPIPHFYHSCTLLIFFIVQQLQRPRNPVLRRRHLPHSPRQDRRHFREASSSHALRQFIRLLWRRRWWWWWWRLFSSPLKHVGLL